MALRKAGRWRLRRWQVRAAKRSGRREEPGLSAVKEQRASSAATLLLRTTVKKARFVGAGRRKRVAAAAPRSVHRSGERGGSKTGGRHIARQDPCLSAARLFRGHGRGG